MSTLVDILQHWLLGRDKILAVGLVPDNDAFAELAKLDDRGYFVSSENCTTATPGIFVAGDCRVKTLRQVATACSDGAYAAIEACNFIR